MSRVFLNWVHRHWRINQHGIRDNLLYYTLNPPEGRKRVVFVGDSFTAGHGVADVEKRFANLYRAWHPELEIQLVANNAWDTGNHIEQLTCIANQGYVFGAVVLMYGLNDLDDISPDWRRMMERVEGSFKPDGLFLHSIMLNWLYFRFKVVASDAFRNYGSGMMTAYSGPVWEEQKKRLRELRSLIVTHGGRFVVVTLPFFNYPAESYPFTAIHKQLEEFWREEGVPHLDLLPILNGRRPRELTVSRFDAHPNELAHRLIAEQIDAFLSGL